MESNSAHWQCSRGNCIFQQPGEFLVVVRIKRNNNNNTFTWLRIYHSRQLLMENEYLFWAIFENNHFTLLDEYECNGPPSLTVNGTVNKKMTTLFNKKKDEVDTFKRNILSLWEKIAELKKELKKDT